jgi:mono/diheme cytochrome c family protein
MWRVLAVAWLLAAAPGHAADGAYLFSAAGCLACHTAEDGPPLAGGRALDTRYGVFYTPNITPDVETGIGGWTRAQFVNALKHGTAPDGSAYFPTFPYTSYRQMSDADAGMIFDYLQSVAPQRRPNREHELPWWLARWMIKLWQWWVLDDPEPVPPDVRDDPLLSRGRYLVDALGHCGECHTPRNWLGVSIRSRYLAGARDGPEGDKVPNITPDRDDGIGRWDADDLAWFLESGELPGGDYTGGLMTEVVDNATAKLTAADRDAMVAYLRSLSPLPGP